MIVLQKVVLKHLTFMLRGITVYKRSDRVAGHQYVTHPSPYHMTPSLHVFGKMTHIIMSLLGTAECIWRRV